MEEMFAYCGLRKAWGFIHGLTSILNEPKKSLEGLGNMHCTSVLTMKEKNAF